MSKRKAPRGNKIHRKAAALYAKSDAGHWHRRIIKEMKDSTRVQNLAASGALDRYLETK